jgi:hypothetical protein
MTDQTPTVEISPLSQDFTYDGLTVDVMIYKIEGNDGWTLEVAIDEQTSVTWTDLFPSDQAAWDEFSAAAMQFGLRELLDVDAETQETLH